MDAAARAEALAAYAAETAGCVRCPLAETRTQVVFGSGNPDAELMLVGEAPGFHEDQGGLPFAGQAGELLERLLGGNRPRPRRRLPRERAQVQAAAEPRPARGGDRGLRAASVPPDRARSTSRRRHPRELRDEAPLRPVVRDHAGPRPGARGDARRRRASSSTRSTTPRRPSTRRRCCRPSRTTSRGSRRSSAGRPDAGAVPSLPSQPEHRRPPSRSSRTTGGAPWRPAPMQLGLF